MRAPVREKKTRQNKNLQPGFDLIRTDQALVFHPIQLIAQRIGGEKIVHQRGRPVPVIGTEAVARGDKTRAGLEHLVLLVTRAEL